MMIRLSAVTIALSSVFLLTSSAQAAGYGHSMQGSSSPVMRTRAATSFQSRLFTSPGIVEVGRQVTLSVVAPFPSRVRVSFRSFHHSFSGTALYQPSARSYVVTVRLLLRMHGTERAQVVAAVTPRATGRTYQLFSQFLIRGQSMEMSGIPQHNAGDADADNNGASSDGDGNR